MASNFPSSLDSFTNPSSSDAMDSVSVPHATQHSDLNDAVEALQAKVGADSSAVSSSHDYKIADHASRLTTLEGAAGSGLVLVSRTTIGTAVSSVTVSDAFSTDHDNYRILISGGATSAGTDLRLRLGATTSGYCHQLLYGLYTASIYAEGSTTGAAYSYAGSGSTSSIFACVDIQSPFLAKDTYFQSAHIRNNVAGTCQGMLPNTTSYTSFTIIPNAGTITGGTIDVYGYAKA